MSESYHCTVCGRSDPQRPGEPQALQIRECETCGEPVCRLCRPDHETICAQARASFRSSLGKA